MNPETSNLFADLPEHATEELFTILLDNPYCRIERIVSYGQSSPDGFWYDQAWDEWVLLLKGSAELDLNGRMVNLTPGDHLLIPAGLRHRVCKTEPDQPTVWLAIHLEKATKA
jgi:cupin 2 domain-containing protein